MMRNVALSGWLAVAFLASPALADGRGAADILKELNPIAIPKVDASRLGSPAYVKEFNAKKAKVLSKRAELIGELYKADPLNPRLATLLPARWQVLLERGADRASAVLTESTEVLARNPPRALKTEATYAKASSALVAGKGDSATTLKDVEAFVKLAPKDFRSAELLYAAASETEDETRKTELLKRVMADYPKSKVASDARESLKSAGTTGKPFNLAFTDAIKGTEVSMKSLKGKVVVVDFWATWCGPCVAEMPKMKKLYAEFKDQGVEFVGVSLDAPEKQGGLEKLKAYVVKNDITWPQYYQGNGWKSEFSSSLGINSIPCVYLVDPKGKLVSTEARGKLETMIPKLLKKAGRGRGDVGG